MRIVLRMLEPLPRPRSRALQTAIRLAIGVPAYTGLFFASGVFIIPLVAISAMLRLSRTHQIIGVALGEVLVVSFLCLVALRIWQRWRMLRELVLDDVVFMCGVIVWAAVAPLYVGYWGYS